MENFFSGLGAILTVLASLCFVLFLAYYLLHWLNRRMPTQGASGSIKILDRVNIGREKSLLVIKAGGKTMLIAMSDNAIEKLAEYESDEPFIIAKSAVETMDFKTALRSAVSKWPSKREAKEDKTDDIQ
ncbi:MAG: flagellar biosynthetic protein FliO [Oscillospiraceae bacterium]